MPLDAGTAAYAVQIDAQGAYRARNRSLAPAELDQNHKVALCWLTEHGSDKNRSYEQILQL